MSSHSQKGTKLSVKELCILSILGAIVFVGKFICTSLPNIHPVALFIIAITIVYGAKAFYSVVIYIAIEILVYGFGVWSMAYLYIWFVLVALVLLFRDTQSRVVWTVLAALHGFCFGAMCAIPYLFIGGWAAAFSYWVAGISFDLIHGVSNAVICFFLLDPLVKLLERLKKIY